MNPRPVSPINNLKHWRTPAASRSSNGRCRWTFALAAVAWCGLVWLANPPTLAKPPDSALKSNPTKTKEGTVKPEGPAPVIKVDNPTKDLGATWVGPMLEHAFTITNEGDAPLEITKVRPACGCMIAGPYPKTIEPKKSGEFPFKVNSTKLRGKYEKSITISSNDPVTPALKLKLRGEVKRYVEVLPTSANFGKVTTNEPRERVLKITNNTDKPLELNLTKTEDQIFRFDLVEKKPGQEYELRVKMDPPYVPGAPRGMTTLVTNLKQQKDINIRVSARIPGRLEVQPPAILFDSEKHKDRGYSRPIRFTNYGSNPVHLLGVASDDPQSIQVAMKERTAGRAYTVNVEIPAGYTPPDTGRTITLKTDDPDKPTITIPVKRRASRSAEKTPRKRPAEEMVGKPAQSFTAVTTQGATFSSASLQGKVTVMDFFAPNCGYCKKQIPRMEKIRQAYTDKDVRFVVVSQTMRKKYTDQQVKGTINELGFNGELVIDHDNNIGPLFKSTSFPTMVIVGKTGKIEAVNVGNVGDLEDRMKGQLDALLAGQPVPKVAKKTPPKKEDTKPDKPRKRPIEELVGQPAPSFELTTTGGRKLSSKTMAGKVTVLDFFAVNCGYCGKQIPRVEKIRQTYADKGVQFVAVSQTMRKKFTDDEVKAKINDLGFKGDLAIDSDNTVGPLFKATGFPSMVIVGKTGKVEAVNIGNVGDLEDRMKGQLDALLAGQPVPKVAKKTPPKKEDPKPDKPRKRPIEELVGQPAPSFELTTTGGRKLSSKTMAGKVTVLDFFAVNCGYCGKQIPRVEKIRQTYADKGVQFVAVSQTMRKKFTDDEVKAKINDLGFKGDLAIDSDNTVGPLFKATGFPSMVIVGKTGKVEAVNIGNVGDLEDRMKGQLDALLAGQPVPKVAKKTPPKKDTKPKQAEEGVFGKPAPKFELTSTAGKKVSNDTLANTVTVLDFFAPNCGYCGKQLPRVEGIRKTYADKGVRFIAVGETMRKKFTDDEYKAKLAEFGFAGELAIDPDNKVGRMFQIRGFPSMVVLGKTGKVESVNVGNIADLEEKLTGQLDALLAGTPIPEKYVGKPRPRTKKQRPAEELVGKPAPGFELTTTAGQKLSKETLAGKVAVLDFFAPNCGYCGKQIPRVEEIRKTYKEKGVEFVAVGETMRKKFGDDEYQAKLDQFGFKGALAIDPDNKVGQLFKATGFPTMVILGKTGKVEAVNVGNLGDLEDRMKGQLDALLAGKPIPPKYASKPKPSSRKRPAEELKGKPSPTFETVKTLAGKDVSNAGFAGHPATVLNFVAPNCGYCKRQVPKVESIREEYEKKGVRFVNVVQTMRKEYPTDEALEVFKGVGSNLEFAHDSKNVVGKAYQATSFPTMVVVGKDGKVEHVNIGAKPDIDTMLKTQLDNIIAGKPAAQPAGAPKIKVKKVE